LDPPTVLDVIEITVLLSAISQWLLGFAARIVFENLALESEAN
jgi:hypothetical protein